MNVAGLVAPGAAMVATANVAEVNAVVFKKWRRSRRSEDFMLVSRVGVQVKRDNTFTRPYHRHVKGDAYQFCATVIAQSGREQPADATLRGMLKSNPGWSMMERAEMSRALFAYYRWLRWLDSNLPMEEQIVQARQFAIDYHKAPEKWDDAELIKLAVPDWTAEVMNVTAKWTRRLQTDPKLWLRLREGFEDAVRRELGRVEPAGPGALARTVEYTGPVDIFRTQAFHEGALEIQDIGSQFVGFICNPQPGEKWWDACAGEGGKTLHLSALMQNKGSIWATDRAAWRLKILQRRAGRAGVFNYRHASWNGGAKLPTRTLFNGVLIDAPCSGVGTWQRNPHARWTTTLSDVHELAERQRELLTHAVPAVAKGGRLVYAVCSLTKNETEMVADWFDKTFPEFHPLSVPDPRTPGTQTRTRSRWWFWPEETGGNGMFIAVWQKEAA